MLQTTSGSEACAQCWDVTKQHSEQKRVSNVEMLQTTFGSGTAMLRCYKLHWFRSMWAMLMLQTTFGSKACEQCWDVTNYFRIRSMWFAMLRCYKQHWDQKHVSNVEMLQTTFGSEAFEQCWDVTNYIRIRSMCSMLRCYQTTSGSEACEQCWGVTNFI